MMMGDLMHDKVDLVKTHAPLPVLPDMKMDDLMHDKVDMVKTHAPRALPVLRKAIKVMRKLEEINDELCAVFFEAHERDGMPRTAYFETEKAKRLFFEDDRVAIDYAVRVGIDTNFNGMRRMLERAYCSTRFTLAKYERMEEEEAGVQIPVIDLTEPPRKKKKRSSSCASSKK